ncbi:RcpC/CpaB family pilus assembly protein [Streptomyces sp. NBC_01497]|uniref:RcpC/CpaB family pilus assembly protein n=1 Tax=Streptomyces sp. NBC_01497 TaxID=2903885 RepID=UPI002E35EC15|nr:RcpC/CpaB family pilus assembly protein [Streptomyces sp. NBC_01497]
MPEPRGVPAFDPVRVRGQRDRLRRAVLRRRRVMAAGLAVTAAAFAATGAGGATGSADPLPTGPEASPRPSATESPRRATGAPPTDRAAGRTVAAPVRVADAATVGLLQPGDRIDVIATPVPPASAVDGARREQKARIVATGARVVEIPDTDTDASIEGGALLVLSVTRAVAADLASAAAVSQLTVTLC